MKILRKKHPLTANITLNTTHVMTTKLTSYHSYLRKLYCNHCDVSYVGETSQQYKD